MSSKVKWRVVLRRWHALTSAEKLVALTILSHSDPKGWANMSLADVHQTSGGLDNRTIKKAISRLESLGALIIAPSDNKRRQLFRLTQSTAVLKEKM